MWSAFPGLSRPFGCAPPQQTTQPPVIDRCVTWPERTSDLTPLLALRKCRGHFKRYYIQHVAWSEGLWHSMWILACEQFMFYKIPSMILTKQQQQQQWAKVEQNKRNTTSGIISNDCMKIQFAALKCCCRTQSRQKRRIAEQGRGG